MEDVAEIMLTKGYTALVDASDEARVRCSNWYYSRTQKCEYAIKGEKGKTIYLHRFILDAPRGLEVDHINGNGLDCRRTNLRLGTHAENRRNNRLNSNNKSGYKGVHFAATRGGGWRAQIMINGVLVYLGSYANVIDAAWAYDEAAREIHGPFASLNGVEKPPGFVSRRGLRAVIAAAPTCPHGHPWTPENTYKDKKGHRMCRQCHRERERIRQRQLKNTANPED